MPVPFKNVPSNLRIPLFFAEVDNSQANSASAAGRALLIGQITSTGLAAPNVPLRSLGVGDAKTQGGVGSMLAGMATAYRANDSFGDVWYLPLADAGGGAAATGTIVFGGPTTAAGTLALYIAGAPVPVPLTSGMASTAVATAVNAAINLIADLPVTSAVTSSTVTLTAKNKGLAGNDIDIRTNYLGSPAGEVTPAGLTATITGMASGTTNPTLTTALANLGDMPFDFIVSPYTDATSIAAMTAFLNDATGRWGWQAEVYGGVFMAYRGTYGALGTFGVTNNDQHTSCMGFYDSPSPVWAWAAAVAGAAANSLRTDPGRPLQTLTINGVLAPPVASRFTLAQRNALLFDGISTFTVDQSGAVAIENLITTYQINGFGQPDTSYLEVETLYTLASVLRSLKAAVTSKYSRVKLGVDGTRYGPTSGVVTPSTIRGDIIAQYQQLEAQGLVQNSTAFAAGLVVQQNSSNPNRVDVLWPGTLINQLRTFALLAQFRLN